MFYKLAPTDLSLTDKKPISINFAIQLDFVGVAHILNENDNLARNKKYNAIKGNMQKERSILSTKHKNIRFSESKKKDCSVGNIIYGVRIGIRLSAVLSNSWTQASATDISPPEN